MRVHRRGAAALFAAFDLDCSLRPLPLCGGVTKASAFGDTAFLREKAVRKRARGAHPLNPAIGSLTIGRLHALCKILPAMLGAAFDLDCSLRPLPLCGEVTDYFFFGGANVSVRPRR